MAFLNQVADPMRDTQSIYLKSEDGRNSYNLVKDKHESGHISVKGDEIINIYKKDLELVKVVDHGRNRPSENRTGSNSP